MMRLTRASILKASASSSSATLAVAARSSCSISFIQSSLVWCCTMNSISLCVGRERMLRVQDLVEVQVVAVAHGLAEVQLRFFVDDVLG
jgi:hypothetical protein